MGQNSPDFKELGIQHNRMPSSDGVDAIATVIIFGVNGP